ncbi:MAG TPA: hypothetical protein VJP77_02220, partial [Planctomycetota bacterium]|nr:hypothetical protein [Planctomycetota bacterium]
AALAAAAALAACSDDDEGLPAFVVKTVPYAADPAHGIVVTGSRCVFLADEALQGPAGTDLDGDGNADDLVAVAFDMATLEGEPKVLAAAERATIVQNRAYIAGYEPGSSVLSLLTFDLTQASPPLVKIDEIDPASTQPIVRSSEKLFWVTAAPTGLPGETGLRFVRPSAPATPVTVLADDLASAWQPRLLGESGGAVLLALDETVEGVALNADGLADDGTVLGLLNAKPTNPVLANVGLALADDAAPFAVEVLGSGSRRVAFLVDEAAEGQSFNDATRPEFGAGWEFGPCAGNDDTDQTDRVLHWLLLETWLAGTTDPVNTGLVGSTRILLTGGHLATLAAEADQGPGGCDWDGDGAADDVVLRWVPAHTSAIVPENADALQRAV